MQFGSRKFEHASFKKLNIPQFLHILLHMIDFMSHYKLISCIIKFLHKLKYRMR